jgi:hypothetical protein
MSKVRGRGGRGGELSPFPPAHRLIELHYANRDYVFSFFLARNYHVSPLNCGASRHHWRGFSIGPSFSFSCRSPFSREKFRRQDGLRATISNSVDHSIPPLWPSCFSRRQEFTAKLPCAAGSLLSSANSVSCRGNLVAKDDLDSACAAWRPMAQRRCVWFCPPLHIFWAAVRQALGRRGAARDSTPPWLHPPIHIPEPCLRGSIASLPSRLQL